METIAHRQLIVAIFGVIIAGIALFFAMPNLLQYLGERKLKKRQDHIRDVLLKYGPSCTGDFMFRCPQLSQDQRDKALQEMERDGEIYSHIEVNGSTRWYFKIDRDPQSHAQKPRIH
jgi:hypothetical protein